MTKSIAITTVASLAREATVVMAMDFVMGNCLFHVPSAASTLGRGAPGVGQIDGSRIVVLRIWERVEGNDLLRDREYRCADRLQTVFVVD